MKMGYDSSFPGRVILPGRLLEGDPLHGSTTVQEKSQKNLKE